mmetsp:Transcript_96020/g.266743  ORF Transcript_96020/g.266743 Transcript_96020/m.266743 type:complete len:243 (-) Transcript_96020:919-1647(-)
MTRQPKRLGKGREDTNQRRPPVQTLLASSSPGRRRCEAACPRAATSGSARPVAGLRLQRAREGARERLGLLPRSVACGSCGARPTLLRRGEQWLRLWLLRDANATEATAAEAPLGVFLADRDSLRPGEAAGGSSDCCGPLPFPWPLPWRSGRAPPRPRPSRPQRLRLRPSQRPPPSPPTARRRRRPCHGVGTGGGIRSGATGSRSTEESLASSSGRRTAMSLSSSSPTPDCASSAAACLMLA